MDKVIEEIATKSTTTVDIKGGDKDQRKGDHRERKQVRKNFLLPLLNQRIEKRGDQLAAARGEEKVCARGRCSRTEELLIALSIKGPYVSRKTP